MAQEQHNALEIDKWLKLLGANSVGPTTFSRLLKHFGTVDRALGASVNELTRIDGIGFKTAEEIVRTRSPFDAEAELELAEKIGVWIIHIEDQRYPPVLRQIYDPPPVLYIKGTLTRQDNLAAAIVGTRRCSIYGREQASRFAHWLSSAGFTIVSGMARGVDTAAHHGALTAGGRTIAVQGCGLANIFPPENDRLFQLIAESGACVSELPLRYEPLSENFPPRNRIIAGLSLGTIVVEAPLNSGALITARAALENNREVMAVPGESVDDVMEALGYVGEQLKDHAAAAAKEATQKAELPLFDAGELKLTDDERAIYECLTREPLHVDQIIAETNLEAGKTNAGIISLRLKGLIKQFPGSLYMRK
jgi:DNA processing protein